jgi:hypothetical protein
VPPLAPAPPLDFLPGLARSPSVTHLNDLALRIRPAQGPREGNAGRATRQSCFTAWRAGSSVFRLDCSARAPGANVVQGHTCRASCCKRMRVRTACFTRA